MKRIAFSAALITFIAGVLLALDDEQIHLGVAAIEVHDTRPAQSRLSGELELQFMQFTSNQHHTYARYKVTNGSSETVRYPGYATNSNCVMFIRQDGWIKPADDTQTGNNFGTQSLLTGQTFINDVRIPNGKGAFEIGFAYEVGNEHVWRIAWSEEIKPPAKSTKTY